MTQRDSLESDRMLETTREVLYVKRLDSSARLPIRTHPGDTGLDLFACEEVNITPGEWGLVSTGVALELPEKVGAEIRPRSGLAVEHGVTVLNAPGTIDNGYRGEVKVLLINHGKNTFTVRNGMRIAQLVLQSYVEANPEWRENLTISYRGEGGFGSTGK